MTTVGQTALPSCEKNTARKNADVSARIATGKRRVSRRTRKWAIRGQSAA
jgi:hypothetical protein